MGGADTEVSEGTRNIALEVANFDMNTIRKSAMHHGLFTEAATRFTKNQSPRQNLAVLVKAIEQIKHLAGGRQASPVIDDKHFKSEEQEVKLTVQFINECLGLALTASEIKKLLENVEFEIAVSGEKLVVKAPFWRTDIEIPEDIVEEVGRLYGYDHLPLVLPHRDLTPANLNEALVFKSKIRQILSAAGANEVLTYSFVHGSLIKNSCQDIKDAYHLKNALSPDLQYYRLSLTPSLLEKIHPNIKAGFDQFVLFELGKVHSKSEVDKEDLPKEFDRLAVVTAENTKKNEVKDEGVSYFRAKQYASYLFEKFQLDVKYEPLGAISLKGHKLSQQMVTPFEPKRSAAIFVDGKMIGVIGEYNSEISNTLKLPTHSSGFELFFSALETPTPARYQPLNKFPAVEQDLCLRTSAELTYGELTDFVLKTLGKISAEHGYKYELSPVDIYQRPGDKAHKQTTWHITLAHPEKTLTSAEANKVLDKIAAEAKRKLNAERI